MSVVGRLSTQKKPMSSKHLMAKLLPAPLSPVMTTNDRGVGMRSDSEHAGVGRRAAGPDPAPPRPRLSHLPAQRVDGALHGGQEAIGARRAREAALPGTRDHPGRPLESLRAAGDAHLERR